MRFQLPLTASEVSATLVEMYGNSLRAADGVVHVTSAWEKRSGRFNTLRIGPHTPVSAVDRLVLGVARARADAIVTTGRILRSEPGLTHDTHPDAVVADALLAWRRQVLGRDRPPWIVVLTRGEERELDHRLYRTGNPALVLTSDISARHLEAPPGVRIEGLKSPSLRSAVQFLMAQPGVRTVAVEAGPTTSRELYQAPAPVDELMLSLFLGPSLDERVRGPELPPLAAICEVLPTVSPGWSTEEPSGRWRFLRFTR